MTRKRRKTLIKLLRAIEDEFASRKFMNIWNLVEHDEEIMTDLRTDLIERMRRVLDQYEPEGETP